MKIYLVKKEKGRVYKSEEIVRALFGFELNHDEHGSPYIAGSSLQAERFISITDTKNYWACAIEDYPIGIDMEESGRVIKPEIAKRLHKDEQDYLAALSEGGREWSEEFLSIWTRKEAYSKLCGKGLKLGFSRFSVLEGLPVASFAFKGLVFGIAGTGNAEVIQAEYDAPMEQSALDYAAGLLDVRGYTAAALMEKLLARGYSREASQEAIEKLKEYGYINDEAYAESLARRAADSGRGSRRIAYELKEKGIDKDLASRAASGYKESDYSRAFETARKLAEKAGWDPTVQPAPDSDLYDPDSLLTREEKEDLYTQRRKLAGKISRKLSALGYDASFIYSVLEDLGL